MEQLPAYPGKPLETLFPDSVFPPLDDENPQLTPAMARDLLSKMLVIDPEHRITIDQALKHPYVNMWYETNDVESVCLFCFFYFINRKIVYKKSPFNLFLILKRHHLACMIIQ